MLVNLTPHAITVVLPSGKRMTVQPSGIVARVSATVETAGTIYIDDEPITLARPRFGAVENLPAPQPETYLIVSAMVKDRLPDRHDVIAPGTDETAERNDKGQISAVRRFLTR